MAPVSSLDHLSNPLVTTEQLYRYQNSTSDLYGEDAQSLQFASAQLTQAAGVLLRLPQEVIATAIVLLQRYMINSHNETSESPNIKISSSAAIYLTAKLSFTPLSPRSVINVYAYLTSTASPLCFINPSKPPDSPDPSSYFVSEGTYERERQRLFTCESTILTGIGFDTHVALPYTLALTYLQALGVGSRLKLAQRTLEHLNGGLLSPQLLYLTLQPNALAVGAIYLAAREVDVKLVDGNWWEVFDVDREDLGFLVLAYGSLDTFAKANKQKWDGRAMPFIIS